MITAKELLQLHSLIFGAMAKDVSAITNAEAVKVLTSAMRTSPLRIDTVCYPLLKKSIKDMIVGFHVSMETYKNERNLKPISGYRLRDASRLEHRLRREWVKLALQYIALNSTEESMYHTPNADMAVVVAPHVHDGAKMGVINLLHVYNMLDVNGSIILNTAVVTSDGGRHWNDVISKFILRNNMMQLIINVINILDSDSESEAA